MQNVTRQMGGRLPGIKFHFIMRVGAAPFCQLLIE